MKDKTSNKGIFEYLVVLMMFIASGTQYFFIFNGKYTVPIYLILGMMFGIQNIRQIKTQTWSFRFLIFWLVWTAINFYLINPHHVKPLESQYTIYVMLIVPTYFIISSLTFVRFKKIFLNVCFWITVYSLLVYLLFNMDLIHAEYIKVRSNPIGALIAWFNCMGWDGPFQRLAGLYWEPGAYAIILNIALILHIEEIKEWRFSKGQKIKLGVILLALLLTKSTAGYLCLMFMVAVAVYYSRRMKKNIGVLFVAMPIVLGGMWLVYNSTTVQNKLNQRGYENTSYENRLADNLAMIQMIKEKPAYGYGLSSIEFKKRSDILGNTKSSNGLLKMCSTFGLIFTLVYFLMMYHTLKQEFGRMRFFIFPLILFLNAFEVFYYFPLAYIFLFSFKEFLPHKARKNPYPGIKE